MQFALNGSEHTGGALAEDIRLARDAGFAALEMWIPKLEYALQGGSLSFVTRLLKGGRGDRPVRVAALNRLQNVIFLDRTAAARLEAQTHSLAASAMSLGSNWIILEAGDAPPGVAESDVTAEVATAIARIARIATQYGTINVAIEPGGALASVAQALAALAASGRSNTGLALAAADLAAAAALPGFDGTKVAVVHVPPTLPADLFERLAGIGYDGTISVEPPAQAADIGIWAQNTRARLEEAAAGNRE